MQEHNDIFDLQIKEMLSDAKVTPPSGAWEAVCAGMGVPASPKRGAAWWWESAAGLAIAASLAAFLILRGPQNPGTVASDDNLTAMVEIAEPEHTGTVEESLMLADAAPQYRKVRPASQPVRVDEVLKDDVPASASNDSVSQTPSTEEQQTVANGEKKQNKSTSARRWTDPFAQMSYEDAKTTKASRISVSASGTVGGNDSNFASNRSPIYKAFGQGSTPKASTVTESSVSNYGIPLSLGLGAKIEMNEQFSIGTGITWSMLSRTFTGTYYDVKNGALLNSVSGDFLHNCQYIGIPVNVYYNIIKTSTMHFYVYGGGSAEFCLSSRYSSYGTGVSAVNWKEPVKGMQGSAVAGIGVEFKLSDHLGLYLDPGARYYFSGNGQPKSVRTDKPFMVNFEAGLRFNIH